MERLSEQLALVGVITPALTDNAAVTTAWVDMEAIQRVLFIGLVGATDIGVNAKLQVATNSSGAGAADLSGFAITAFIATDDNKQFMIEVREDQLGGSFTHVRLSVTVADGTAGAYVAAVALAGGLAYGPAKDVDLATVAQIV